MSIAKTYTPADVEAKWYQRWQEQGFFKAKANPRKQPYSVVIPPPNVTGVLHMGHMLNNTIQDVLVRLARMQGKEACWVPGTDHASIATEAKVVALLKEQGIEKKDLTREQFLEHAFAWKEKYGGIILEQLKQLGASCDWDRTRFTMEPELTEAVLRVFVDLHQKGLIYRGIRMVNWDPQSQTAISDEEVIPKDVMAKMYHLRYAVVGAERLDNGAENPEKAHVEQAEFSGLNSQFLVVATSRPETIMADVAVAVNPNDPRYTHLHGAKVRIPLLGREIPVILDEYVSIDFGTGALKVTPAHDLNDYELGVKHSLPVIDILNNDGSLNEKAVLYVGQDRFAARRNIVKDLEEAGHLVKVEEYASIVQTSERTKAVIEPRLSMQWFLKMEHLAKPALEVVESDQVKLHPAKFKNTYRVWMENVHDWCISRQLWWGQQIPAYYLPDGTYVVALTPNEALELARTQSGNANLQLTDLRQDEDVLDTWFSSWLWPISVFDGFKDPDNADINYFYPTNDLVTGPDILFFWVARMIMAGLEFRREIPFRNVYLTGIVRDAQGRKMSKQLGNSPDPLDLIKQFGADGVRTGMLFSAPAGNDLLYDEKLVEQGRNFCNKLWNAFRLTQGWEVDATLPFANNKAVEWFTAKLQTTLVELDDHFEKFRISDALMTVYKLVWDDFCSVYLEMIKPAYQAPIDPETLRHTTGFLETLLKLLHPFMPFITEEIWHELAERGPKDYVCVATWPKQQPVAGAPELLARMDKALDIVAGVRNIRNQKGLGPNKPLTLAAKTDDAGLLTDYDGIIRKLASLTEISVVDAAPAASVGFVSGGAEFFVPLEGQIDLGAEKERLTKELEYAQGFRDSVLKKLSNEKFVANAKADLVERERQKLADAESKITALEQSLAAL
ncbi:valine--tRNA ligase [Hymenobacter taeanensis]|uniref:Valine--tRNA ligase n=1 Tax=Hymenobacter taeanensis TaxID=2735321 RepID=A0A6M6BIL5_9BACT|nr:MULTISPECIES: valine--tRNA ligase [Hymenobacter]QJX48431.1 valine--tRNA ligase [Hymenobacter taeanensis]UOQ82073.1 valine--tRNA ligase [Hymenobacter sp. 5414T-23]